MPNYVHFSPSAISVPSWSKILQNNSNRPFKKVIGWRKMAAGRISIFAKSGRKAAEKN